VKLKRERSIAAVRRSIVSKRCGELATRLKEELKTVLMGEGSTLYYPSVSQNSRIDNQLQTKHKINKTCASTFWNNSNAY
jgi:hypothetical protein